MNAMRFFYGHKLVRAFIGVVLCNVFLLSNFFARARARGDVSSSKTIYVFGGGGGIGDDLIALGYVLARGECRGRAIFICNAKSHAAVLAVLSSVGRRDIDAIPLHTNQIFRSSLSIARSIHAVLSSNDARSVCFVRMTPVLEWGLFAYFFIFKRYAFFSGYLRDWRSFYEFGCGEPLHFSWINTRQNLYFYQKREFGQAEYVSSARHPQKVSSFSVVREKYLVVCPIKTALWPAGRWNSHLFFNEVKKRCQIGGIKQIYLLGGPQDHFELQLFAVNIRKIYRNCRVNILAGEPWEIIVDVLNECSAFIGVDNGLAHLATVLGVSDISTVFSFSDPRVFSPSPSDTAYVPDHFGKLKCQPCVGHRWSPTDFSIVRCPNSAYCDKGQIVRWRAAGDF